MKEESFEDRSGEGDSPECERSGDEIPEQAQSDEDASLTSPNHMLRAMTNQLSANPLEQPVIESEPFEIKTANDDYESEANAENDEVKTVCVPEPTNVPELSEICEKTREEPCLSQKTETVSEQSDICVAKEPEVAEPPELSEIKTELDSEKLKSEVVTDEMKSGSVIAEVKGEPVSEAVTLTKAPVKETVPATTHAKDSYDKDSKPREKRYESRSRERRHSDSRRHHHSSSHQEKSSSKSQSHHYSHGSRDHRNRSSHGDSKGHSSRSRPRTYNVRIQTDHESIIQEMQVKSGNLERPKKTRVPWYPHPHIMQYKHRKYFRIETDPNGGADVCHMYWDEICHLNSQLRADIALEFIKLTYSEDADECAYHVIGIVHDAAGYLPDLVDYMADHYGSITVKTGSLTGRGTQSMTMACYRDEVYKTYSKGIFRYPPLQEISICGVQGEEVGAYFPDFVNRLETSPCMRPVMPWSSHSVVATNNPRESNDGPIFWVRPGEQTLPSCEGARSKGRIAKGVSRLSEAREALFEDRTKPHADQIGIDGVTTDTAPTAAVGVLKAVVCGNKEDAFTATKDVIAFHARDYNALVDLLQIDVYEPPLKQCPMWLETAKLNSLRRQGIRYAHIQLHGNDVYYLPRKIIHQFQTISAVASVAWHVRWKDYFLATGAPNLHTPTGLNKGAVYYEKKHVPVYEPPKPEDLSDDDVYVTPKKHDKSISRNSRSRTKKLISEGSVTPGKQEASSSLSKVRRLDIDTELSHRKEPESNVVKSTPSKKRSTSCCSTPSRRHSSSASTAGSSAPIDVLNIASTSAATLPSQVAMESPTTKGSELDVHRQTALHSSAETDGIVAVSSEAEKLTSDRRRSADDATVQRSLERRPSLESLCVTTPVKVQVDSSHRKRRADSEAVTPSKVEKPLRENILAKKRRKAVSSEEKPKTYDVLGDIMQQMDKSKTF